MDFDEHFKTSGEIQELLYNNLYKLELLKGYCISKEPYEISPEMASFIVSEIYENHKTILHLFDKYSTKAGYIAMHNI